VIKQVFDGLFVSTCCARRLVELCPDDPSGYSNRGYAFRKLGDYEAAVEDYSAAIALSPASSTRLHNNRAYCLAKLGRYQEAIADYDAVVALDPDNVHAYHNRCVGHGRRTRGLGWLTCVWFWVLAGIMHTNEGYR
jgi:tetratricopeptide (TPR) repeat protein